MSDGKIKYFLYSSEQFKFRKQMESIGGKEFKAGTVLINGNRKLFTELSNTPKSRFSDAIVIAVGNPDMMSYTMPGGI